MLGACFANPGEVAVRLDYAFSNAGAMTLAFGGEMILAGLMAQIASKALRSLWGGEEVVRNPRLQ